MNLRPTLCTFLLVLSERCRAQEFSNQTSSTIVTTQFDVSHPRMRGWTKNPDGRGTPSIIWTCCLTMFLSSWSILCLNVPACDDGWLQLLWRRAWISALSFLGPEFIFGIALGQWLSARNSVKQFEFSNLGEWSMTHAFYADMGGFTLSTPDFVPFPIDAKQLHYLITKNYISKPIISKNQIRDKNKVDGLLRIIVIIQITWFMVDTCGRAAQRLAITPGELTTAAFIVCSFGTTLCWIHKPADVTTPEIINCETELRQILVEAGNLVTTAHYDRTPLDFISRREWPWSLYWTNWINNLRVLGINFGPKQRPVDRFENTIPLHLPGGWNYVFVGSTMIYSSIFLTGWNFEFPTYTEKILWRCAGLAMIGTVLSYALITEFAFRWYPALQERLQQANPPKIEHPSGYPQFPSRAYTSYQDRIKTLPTHLSVLSTGTFMAWFRNNSVARDPVVGVPLKAILPVYVVAFFYCLARVYIFVADIICARSLPESAYETVEWMDFVPHF